MGRPRKIQETPDLPMIEGENARQYEAFLDYIALGPGRTLQKLLTYYASDDYKRRSRTAPTAVLQTLKDWSSQNQWQARLDDYVTIQQQAFLKSQGEAFNALLTRALSQTTNLVDLIEHQIETYQDHRVVKKVLVDDPSNPGAKIQAVYLKANAGDLERLVRMHGTLYKDLRSILGMDRQTVAHEAGKDTQVKMYIGFDPGANWPAPAQDDDDSE